MFNLSENYQLALPQKGSLHNCHERPGRTQELSSAAPRQIEFETTDLDDVVAAADGDDDHGEHDDITVHMPPS